MPLSMAIDARRSSDDGTLTHLSTSTIVILLNAASKPRPLHKISHVVGYLEQIYYHCTARAPPLSGYQTLRRSQYSSSAWVLQVHSGKRIHTDLQEPLYAAKSCSFYFDHSHCNFWMMKSLLILSLLVAAASAHLCLIEPRQRGTMADINTAGETCSRMFVRFRYII